MDDASAPDQLTGWKEIARYLGKSVRAVQRWERDMGLPVHRVRTPSGQSIYARRSEIDTWRLRAEPREAAMRDDAADAYEDTSRASRSWWLLGIGAALLVVAVVTFARVPRQIADPATFVFAGKSIEARASDGRVLWQFAFDAAPMPLDPMERAHAAEGVRRADLDGDGTDEALAIVRLPIDANRHSAVETLYCWNLDGALRWIYRPELTLKFRGGTFDARWKLMDFIHTPALRDPIWVSIGHEQWWPGAVVSLDRHGRPTLRLVHGGLLFALGYAQGERQRRIVAAGVSNGAGAAAMIALDPDGPAASWPQDPQSMFHCIDCPTGQPAAYLLFPRTELGEFDTLPYSTPRLLRVHAGDMEVVTDETQDGVASALFTVDPSFEHASFALGDGFWTAHRRFEAAGKLHHDAAQCPQPGHPMTARRWTPAGGWRPVDVTPSVRGIPASEKF